MPKDEWDTGATRNSIGSVRYDLLEWDFIKDMGEVMGEGLLSHGKNNWKGGVPKAIVINHLLEHLRKHLDEDTEELHLAKIAVNAMMLDYYIRMGLDIKETPNE
jgi:hypothetical protein